MPPKKKTLMPETNIKEILDQEGDTPFIAGGFYLTPLNGGWALGQITEAERAGNLVRGLLRVPGRAPLFVTAGGSALNSTTYVGRAISSEDVDKVVEALKAD